jgi:sugar O-acyltransferase (sialic acid O-acetyltransferase NeuD family)
VKKVILFGYGQVASAYYAFFTHDSPHEVVAFTVDGEYIEEKSLFGLPIVPFENIENRYPPDEYEMFLSISYRKVNKLREQKYEEAKAKGYTLISHISPQATTWPGLVIGDNCYIKDNCIIQPFVEIGNNVIIWSGSHVGHHVTIKDHAYLASSAVVAGNVTIEPYCFLGVNSTVRDGITIARECVIGAGAVILKDTQEKGVYMGNPAKRLPQLSDNLHRI